MNKTPDTEIAAMHAEHLAGASLRQLSAKYGHPHVSILQMFKRRGLRTLLRPSPGRPRIADHLLNQPRRGWREKETNTWPSGWRESALTSDL